MVSARRALRMLENESLWEAAERLHAALARKAIEHAIIGGVVGAEGVSGTRSTGTGTVK